jgi:hypothetical protein
VKACQGDLSAAIIVANPEKSGTVSPEIEDLHHVLNIGLEAGK